MKSLKIPFLASGEDIIKEAEKKHGKHKKVAFALWPDNTLRVILKEENNE